MWRFAAGAAAVFLLLTGGILMWQGKAQESPLPPAPAPASGPSMVIAQPQELPEPPEATPRSREQKRFARADKDDDGRITRIEMFEPRRKAYAKLDKDGNGSLSFDEWAVRTVEKFAGADRDRSGWLSPAEFATTAPPRRKKPACAC